MFRHAKVSMLEIEKFEYVSLILPGICVSKKCLIQNAFLRHRTPLAPYHKPL